MLEREAKREKTLESATREKRIKAAQKRPNSSFMPAGVQLEELLKAAEEDFYALIDDGSGKIKDDAISRARDFEERHSDIKEAPPAHEQGAKAISRSNLALSKQSLAPKPALDNAENPDGPMS
jgi:hypothetical protein